MRQEEQYKFNLGQRVEFIVEVGPFASSRKRTIRGVITGRYTTGCGTPIYQIEVGTKVAGRNVPVYDKVYERDIRGNLVQRDEEGS